MISRFISKSRGRCFFLFILLVAVISIIYLYLIFVQENFKSMQWSEKRCLSELTSVKSQLKVVTEYKNRIDKMLSETQIAHESDKDKFKDIMENFKAMKQQSVICQSQFDDLQEECKKVRETYNQENKELIKLNEQYEEVLLRNEKLENSIKDQYNYIDKLRAENSRLQLALQGLAPQMQNNIDAGVRHYSNRTFSHQLEETDGVYKIDMKSNINNELKNKVQKNEKKEEFAEPPKFVEYSDAKNHKRSNDEIAQNPLPPGFAPVLEVMDSVNPNLPKPIGSSDNKDKEDKVKDLSNEIPLHAMQEPEDKINIFDKNANINDIDSQPAKKLKELNPFEQLHAVEEDDDDGDEYPA